MVDSSDFMNTIKENSIDINWEENRGRVLKRQSISSGKLEKKIFEKKILKIPKLLYNNGSFESLFEKINRMRADNKKVKDFFVVLSSAKFNWKQDKGSPYLEATINVGNSGEVENNKNDWMYVAINGKARDIFEGKNLNGDFPSLGIPEETELKKFLSKSTESVEVKAFRYIAGGSLPVLELRNGARYAILIRRDENAPTDSECFTTSTGLCEYPKEWEDPRFTIAREFYEEIQIFSSDLRYHYNPKFKFFDEDENEELKKFFGMVTKEYRGKFKRLKTELGAMNFCEKDIEASIVQLGTDTMTIKLPNSTSKKTITGQLVLDPVSGALDLVGSVYLKLCDVDELSQLKIVDFDTEAQGKFLFREIHLIDGTNLRRLIEGEDFYTSVFIRTYDGSKVIINYIESVKYNKYPRLTAPLRGAMVNCYNLFFSPTDQDQQTKEVIWEMEHRLKPLCFSDQLEKSNLGQKTFPNSSINIEIFKTVNIKSLRYGPSGYKVQDWEDNLNWKEHIKEMLAAEPKEFKKIVNIFMQALDKFVPEEFASLPYFTEHYSTHVRDVISNAFEIMNLKKELFREVDYLIITLSALIHDLGQFSPEAKHAAVSVRDDPELLEDFYKELIEEWVNLTPNSKYLNLFGKSSTNSETKFEFSKFAGLVLNIAKYHPKAMLFDKEYEERFKTVVGENMYGEYLEDILKQLLNPGQEDVNHYLLLASILQIADGIDIQKYRNPSLESFKQKFLLLIKNKEVEGRTETLNALVKDALIDNVKIEKENDCYWIVFECEKEQNKGDFEKVFNYLNEQLDKLNNTVNTNDELLFDRHSKPPDLTKLVEEKIVFPTLKELYLVNTYFKNNSMKEFQGVKIRKGGGTSISYDLNSYLNYLKNNNSNVNDKGFSGTSESKKIIMVHSGHVSYKTRNNESNKPEKKQCAFTLEIDQNGTKTVKFDVNSNNKEAIIIEKKEKKLEFSIKHVRNVSRRNVSRESQLLFEFLYKPELENFYNKWYEKTKSRDLFPFEDSVKSLICKIWNGKVAK